MAASRLLQGRKPSELAVARAYHAVQKPLAVHQATINQRDSARRHENSLHARGNRSSMLLTMVFHGPPPVSGSAPLLWLGVGCSSVCPLRAVREFATVEGSRSVCPLGMGRRRVRPLSEDFATADGLAAF